MEEQREVTTDEGVRFAQEFDLVFFEVSAFSGEYIDEAFMRAAADVYMGLITMKYDQDQEGEYIGIKKGNAEVPTTKRLSMQLSNIEYLNTTHPDLRVINQKNDPLRNE